MEKFFNQFIVFVLTALGWMLRLIRIPLGWHGPKFQGNGVATIVSCEKDDKLFVLLVKNRLRRSLELIGGGVEVMEHFDPTNGNFFENAALREIQEEVGVTVHPDRMFIEAVFQKLTPFSGCWITSCVWLYSIRLDSSEFPNWSVGALKLQTMEIAEAMWLPIEEAINNNDIGLGYRRMLLLYWYRHCQRHLTSVQRPIYQGLLSQKLSLYCGKTQFLV